MEEPAFSVYDEMDDTEKKDFDKIKDKMIRTFSMSRSEAYGQFVNRKLGVNESVEVLLTDLRRLLKLTGVTNTNDNNVLPLLCEQFMAALPDDICVQVRSTSFAGSADPDLSTIVQCAKRGLACSNTNYGASLAVAFKPKVSENNEKWFCYRCNTQGHTSQFCKNEPTEQKNC